MCPPKTMVRKIGIVKTIPPAKGTSRFFDAQSNAKLTSDSTSSYTHASISVDGVHLRRKLKTPWAWSAEDKTIQKRVIQSCVYIHAQFEWSIYPLDGGHPKMFHDKKKTVRTEKMSDVTWIQFIASWRYFSFRLPNTRNRCEFGTSLFGTWKM